MLFNTLAFLGLHAFALAGQYDGQKLLVDLKNGTNTCGVVHDGKILLTQSYNECTTINLTNDTKGYNEILDGSPLSDGDKYLTVKDGSIVESDSPDANWGRTPPSYLTYDIDGSQLDFFLTDSNELVVGKDGTPVRPYLSYYGTLDK